MKLFFDLDNQYEQFIKPFDYRSAFKTRALVALADLPMAQVLTDYAQHWFAAQGFVLIDKAYLIKMPPWTTGPLHTDDVDSNDAKGGYAFNWIVYGHGTMSWYETPQTVAEMSSERIKGHRYLKFDNDGNAAKCIGQWSGKAALVDIGTHHQVATTTQPRLCVSIRCAPESQAKTFDQAFVTVTQAMIQ